MKKILLSIFSVLVAAAMIVPGATALAAEPETETQPVSPVRLALVIKSPAQAGTGQQVTITVVAQHNYSPVPGAGVYALPAGSAAITADTSSSIISFDAAVAAVANGAGIYLGSTNGDGIVTHRFRDTGSYVLVAIRNGYTPGFSRIVITLAPAKRLQIMVPSRAVAGSPVTIAVLDAYSHEPVPRAAVYARKTGEVGLPAKTVSPIARIISFFRGTASVKAPTPTSVSSGAVIEADAAPVADEAESAAEISQTGALLGYTDEKGQLIHRFPEAGQYAIAATREDYAPGFARIVITAAMQRALGIKAPGIAEVGRPVPINVFERYTQKPVAQAGLYAFKIGEVITPLPVEEPVPAETDNAAEAEKMAAVAREKGLFLGYTDDYGQITPSFKDSGRYMLVAIKDGYVPGLARIAIVLAVPKALVIKSPAEAGAGEPVRIAVSERHTGEMVAGVEVYRLTVESMDDAMRLIVRAARGNFEALVKEKGVLIGLTGNDGTLVHEFKPGYHILSAIENGYLPDFAYIRVRPSTVAYPPRINAVQPQKVTSSTAQ